MHIKIVKNKYLNALLLLVLFSALVHMIILLYSALRYWDFYFLNYFNILNVYYIFPHFLDAFHENLLSVAVVCALYLVILKINKTE